MLAQCLITMTMAMVSVSQVFKLVGGIQKNIYATVGMVQAEINLTLLKT